MAVFFLQKNLKICKIIHTFDTIFDHNLHFFSLESRHICLTFSSDLMTHTLLLFRQRVDDDDEYTLPWEQEYFAYEIVHALINLDWFTWFQISQFLVFLHRHSTHKAMNMFNVWINMLYKFSTYSIKIHMAQTFCIFTVLMNNSWYLKASGRGCRASSFKDPI